jgi:mannose-1-phosphate guanylyltransferase / phosphomannomutase
VSAPPLPFCRFGPQGTSARLYFLRALEVLEEVCVKAVVMAGGQGTRLRPLTSNLPKPMVPVANKPTALHIMELLARHGITDVIMTVAFLPQLIRNYFGDGSTYGLHVEYSVEETPLGTAGSVKNAQQLLDDTFLVISGDALTDFDLGRIMSFHREREAMVTIALKSVENPLEFGVVIVDDEGRIERFLEKPGWGQVFSDTINTGVYVLEPEIFDYIPEDEPFDFSHELFPRLYELRKPLYGVLMEGYWQDIGTLEQYLEANRDALDGKVKLQIPGVRLRGNVWVGQGVSMDSLTNVEGPAVIGNYCKIDPSASIGAHSVLGNNVVLKAGAQIADSVVGENSYLATGTRIRGAILGNLVDVRNNSIVSEGSVVGDHSSVGENSLIGNNVKIYPFKTVEPGSAIKSSLISETRGMSGLFGRNGVRGLINIDITPERAMRLAMSYGTLLRKGSSVTTSRDGHAASRVMKRAMIAGLTATGVDVRDLRVAPVSVNRFDLKTGGSAGSIHIRMNPDEPEEIELIFAEPPGVPLDVKTERKIENFFHREDFRRAFHDEMGTIVFPPRVHEMYTSSLFEALDGERIRSRGLRVVIDYSYSAASRLLGAVLTRLNVEVLAINSSGDKAPRELFGEALAGSLERARRLVEAMEADLGLILDPAAEHVLLLNERGESVPDEKLLLLLLAHACGQSGPGTVALPLHSTHRAEEVAESYGCSVRRTRSSDAALMAEAGRPQTIFAATVDGGYIFPRFLPTMDALITSGKVLELVATSESSVSDLTAGVPDVFVRNVAIPCPWHLKGAVMRLMVEEVKDEPVSLVDGIKIMLGNDRWVQILPDADEPLFHVYAESDSAEGAESILAGYEQRLRAVISDRKAQED